MKRYDLNAEYSGGEPKLFVYEYNPDIDNDELCSGEWCKYEDVKALEEELKQIKSELANKHKTLVDVINSDTEMLDELKTISDKQIKQLEEKNLTMLRIVLA